MKKQFSFFAFSALILSAAAFSSPVESAVRKQEAAKVDKVQQTDFASFRTHRQGKGITAVWSVTSSNGVAAFSLRKTYEDPSDEYSVWEEVATSPCGTSRSYKFTDKSVTPGFANYKVVAVMNDGSTVESSISTVHIVSR